MIRDVAPPMLMGDVLPPGAQGAECFGDLTPEIVHPAESAAIGSASPARRREFHTVRTLARRALAGIGPEAGGTVKVPLLPDARGAPSWPRGVVGSMTHCRDYRGAVVARSITYAAVGLDAELKRPMPPEVRDLICRSEEKSMMEDLQRLEPSLPWPCVVFSAKESVYKAWYPVTKAWLGFEEVSVQIEPDSGTFRARLMVPAGRDRVRTIEKLQGRWAVAGDFILTTACLPAVPISTPHAAVVGRHWRQ